MYTVYNYTYVDFCVTINLVFTVLSVVSMVSGSGIQAWANRFCPGIVISAGQNRTIIVLRGSYKKIMNKVSRKQALEELEKIARETEKFRYRHIYDYACAYKLSKDDRIWLYKKLKEKNITILGMDPTVEVVKPKKWQGEDGLLYSDYSHVDYEAVYDEITRNCESLKPLVEQARNIKPPQRGEREQLIRKLRQGDNSVRCRIIEMHIRSALLIGFRWSKMLDVDLQDAIGDACEGLVRAANSVDPEKGSEISSYCCLSMFHSVMRGQPVHNTHVYFRKYDLEILFKAYGLLKKHGCLECDRLVRCDEANRLVSEKLNCDEKESRAAILGAMEPLSLEAYLETAVCGGCDGQCEDIREEEDDAPEFEEELSAYCVDPLSIVEDRLAGPGLGNLVQERLCKLNDREKDILERHFGISGGRVYSLEEISRRYGVTRERIRQIEAKALKRLRQDSTWLKKCLPNLQLNQNNVELKKLQADEMRRQEGLSITQINQKEGRKQEKHQASKTRQKEELLVIQLKPKEDRKQEKHQASETRQKEELSDRRLNRRKSMKLSDLIFRYRMKHGLTKSQMAKHCRVSDLTITLLEHSVNMYCPCYEELLQLFSHMEISEEDFMDVITYDKLFVGKHLSWMWEVLCERKLLNCYRKMNKHGKILALAQIETLSESKAF